MFWGQMLYIFLSIQEDFQAPGKASNLPREH